MADNEKTAEQRAAEERAARVEASRTEGRTGVFPTAGNPPKEGPRSLDRQADLNPDRQRVARERPSMGERLEREQARGREQAAANAAKVEEAEISRRREEGREFEEDEAAKTELQKKFEESAAAIDKKMVDLPPPGPGMAKPDPEAVRKTMDPNNPLVNPRASDEERLRRQPLPPGAFSPAPVLPQDTVQTQAASKPPTPAHAEAGEANRGAAETPPNPDKQ